MNKIKLTAAVGFTTCLILIGEVENTAIAIGQTPDDNADHSVPRVPLALAAGSDISFLSTVPTITFTANMVTGEELRVPPLDRVRAAIEDKARPANVRTQSSIEPHVTGGLARPSVAPSLRSSTGRTTGIASCGPAKA